MKTTFRIDTWIQSMHSWFEYKISGYPFLIKLNSFLIYRSDRTVEKPLNLVLGHYLMTTDFAFSCAFDLSNNLYVFVKFGEILHSRPINQYVNTLWCSNSWPERFVWPFRGSERVYIVTKMCVRPFWYSSSRSRILSEFHQEISY